jgi:hypothetical protein
MNNNQHTRILGAYLSRLTLKDINQIKDAIENATFAQLNLNNRAQAEAQNMIHNTTCEIIHNMLQHDKNTIEQIINYNKV